MFLVATNRLSNANKKNALNKDIRSSACCLIRALSTAACSFLVQLYPLHFSIASNLDAVLEFLSVGLFWYSSLWSKFPEQAKEEREILVWLMKHSAPYNSIKDSSILDAFADELPVHRNVKTGKLETLMN